MKLLHLPNDLRVALVQWNIKTNYPVQNIETASELFQYAAKLEVNLVVFPEMWTRGFCKSYLVAEGECFSERLKMCSEWAKKYKVWFAAGTIPEPASGGKVYNSYFLFDSRGEIRQIYRKIHLFPNTDEPLYFEAGTSVPEPITAGKWRLGVGICFDLRFPELFRLQMKKGANLFVVPAQFPYPREAHFTAFSKIRALENLAYCIAVNRCGRGKNLSFPGRSIIADFWGNSVVEMDDQKGVAIGCISIEQLEATRREYPFLKNTPLL